MATRKCVLVIGEDPALVDFADPAIPPGLTAEMVLSALNAAGDGLRALGYDAELCLTDAGDTAEAVVVERLRQTPFDCIVIGAGIRVVPGNFLLFEKLINLLHQQAPQARLAFNTRPDDTIEAVQRWVDASSGAPPP